MKAPNEEAQMNAAIERARKTLPLFWAKLAKPGEGEDGFELQVKMQDSGNSSYFWVTDIERKGEAILGTVANTQGPNASLPLRQRIQIEPDRISDWKYMHNGKIAGDETLRLLMSRTPRLADQFQAMFEAP